MINTSIIYSEIAKIKSEVVNLNEFELENY